MWKGIPFLDSQKDEDKLRRHYRQSTLQGSDIVAYKEGFLLTEYVRQIIRNLDEREIIDWKPLDQRDEETIEELITKIEDYKGTKQGLRTLIYKLRTKEGYNPYRDMEEYRIKEYNKNLPDKIMPTKEKVYKDTKRRGGKR